MNADHLTVVVPVRNGAAHIERTLLSLATQEGGTPAVVVVDDGSTDDSVGILRRTMPGASIIDTCGRGPAAARNAGAARATTPLLGFCDADDMWPAARSRRHIELLRDAPDLDAVLGTARIEADDARLLDRMRFIGSDHVARIWQLGALTVRLAAWRAVGPLAEELRRFEDHDWFLRAGERGLARMHDDEVALIHHLHAGSLTKGRPSLPRERLAVLHRGAKRRRET